MNLLLTLGLAASGWAAGFFHGRRVRKGKVLVSYDVIEDAVKDGVLKKLNQQVLSDETGIKIETFVGGKKNK